MWLARFFDVLFHFAPVLIMAWTFVSLNESIVASFQSSLEQQIEYIGKSLALGEDFHFTKF